MLHPIAFVPALHAWLTAPIVVTWEEHLVALALSLKGLKFGSNIDGSVAVVADVERNDTYGIAGNEKFVAQLIVEHEGKDAVEVLEKVDALFTIEGKDDFAIGTRLEVVEARQTATNFLMVVYLSVDGQNQLPFALSGRSIEGLSPTLWVDNAESLMGKNGRTAHIDSTPIWSAMAQFLAHRQRFITQLLRLFPDIQDCYYTTHVI